MNNSLTEWFPDENIFEIFWNFPIKQHSGYNASSIRAGKEDHDHEFLAQGLPSGVIPQEFKVRNRPLPVMRIKDAQAEEENRDKGEEKEEKTEEKCKTIMVLNPSDHDRWNGKNRY